MRDRSQERSQHRAMTMRAWRVGSVLAIGVLLLLTAAGLLITWFQVDDCAEALRKTDSLFLRDLHRSLVSECAGYREQYSAMKWGSLLAVIAMVALWWLPRRRGDTAV